MKNQNRSTSKVLWISLISAITLFLSSTGIITTDKADSLTQAVNAILTVLVAFGIINDPTNKAGI